MDQAEVVIDQVVSAVNMSAQADIAEALARRATDYTLGCAAGQPDDILGRNLRDVLAKEPALRRGCMNSNTSFAPSSISMNNVGLKRPVSPKPADTPEMPAKRSIMS